MPIHPPFDPTRDRRRERIKNIAAGALTAALVGYLVWAGFQPIAERHQEEARAA